MWGKFFCVMDRALEPDPVPVLVVGASLGCANSTSSGLWGCLLICGLIESGSKRNDNMYFKTFQIVDIAIFSACISEVRNHLHGEVDNGQGLLLS